MNKTLLAVFLLSFIVLAAGHGRKAVGDYSFLVGFFSEPTFQNSLNGVSLTITNATGSYISGQAGLVNVTVTQTNTPNESIGLAIESIYNSPGVYAAYFVPTKAGDYTFHFLGNVLGTAVDVSFTSSTDGFEGVRSTANLVYPPSS